MWKGINFSEKGFNFSQPLFLSEDSLNTEVKAEKKGSFWKPVLITLAVGGITYLIFSVRSK
jgi:hypothetical protein